MTSQNTDGDVTQSTNTTHVNHLPDELTQPEALSGENHHTNSVDDDVMTSDDVMSPVIVDNRLSQNEVSHVTRLQSFVDSLTPVVTGYSVTSQYDRAEQQQQQQQQQQPLDLSAKTTVNTRLVSQHVTQHVTSTKQFVPSELHTYSALIKSRDEWIAEWAVLAAASIHNNFVFNTLPVVTSPLRQSVTSPIRCRRQRRRKLRKLRVSTSSETQQSLSPASTASNRSRDRKHQCVRHCDVISDDVNTSRVIDVTQTGPALSGHSCKQSHVTESLSRDPGCKQRAENVASKHRVESVVPVYIRCEDKTDNSQHPLVSLQNFVTSLIRHHTDVIMTSPLTDASEDKSRDSAVLSNCLSNNNSLICCNL